MPSFVSLWVFVFFKGLLCFFFSIGTCLGMLSEVDSEAGGEAAIDIAEEQKFLENFEQSLSIQDSPGDIEFIFDPSMGPTLKKQIVESVDKNLLEIMDEDVEVFTAWDGIRYFVSCVISLPMGANLFVLHSGNASAWSRVSKYLGFIGGLPLSTLGVSNLLKRLGWSSNGCCCCKSGGCTQTTFLFSKDLEKVDRKLEMRGKLGKSCKATSIGIKSFFIGVLGVSDGFFDSLGAGVAFEQGAKYFFEENSYVARMSAFVIGTLANLIPSASIGILGAGPMVENVGDFLQGVEYDYKSVARTIVDEGVGLLNGSLEGQSSNLDENKMKRFTRFIAEAIWRQQKQRDFNKYELLVLRREVMANIYSIQEWHGPLFIQHNIGASTPLQTCAEKAKTIAAALGSVGGYFSGFVGSAISIMPVFAAHILNNAIGGSEGGVNSTHPIGNSSMYGNSTNDYFKVESLAMRDIASYSPGTLPAVALYCYSFQAVNLFLLTIHAVVPEIMTLFYRAVGDQQTKDFIAGRQGQRVKSELFLKFLGVVFALFYGSNIINTGDDVDKLPENCRAQGIGWCSHLITEIVVPVSLFLLLANFYQGNKLFRAPVRHFTGKPPRSQGG